MNNSEQIFATRVYRCVKNIPKGRVATYKGVAVAAGSPNAYRAVGSALNKNETLIAVPCHRVVRSSGDIGEYVLGRKKKAQLLKSEGVAVADGRIISKKYFITL